jgi:uncharacterized membrane protein
LKDKNYILYYLGISTIAVFLLLSLVFFNYSNQNKINIYDKIVIGLIFNICCIFGISLTKYPGWIRKINKSIKKNADKELLQNKKKYIGHHPNCKVFKNHTFKIKKKRYCAGCFGLYLGSLISIVIMLFYVFNSLEISKTFYYLILFVGFIIIYFSYLEIIINYRISILHIISNILLVVSFLMITISILELIEDPIFAIITILLSFLWVDTRITISKWNHKDICYRCNSDCKMY